jgi:hypothetical protein
MDDTELAELNDKITARGETLGRLVLKRVSYTVHKHLPDARILRLIESPGGAFTLERVSGPSGKVIQRFGNPNTGTEPEVAFKNDVDLIREDLATYVRTGGRRASVIKQYKGDGVMHAVNLRTDV